MTSKDLVLDLDLDNLETFINYSLWTKLFAHYLLPGVELYS